MSDAKVAFITGANKGLGLETARGLAAMGIKVLLGSRDLAKGEAAAETLKGSAPAGAEAVKFDVLNYDDHRALADRLEREYGRLDILVNNAGIQHVESVENFPADQWEKIIAINLSSAFYATRAAIPIMKAQGRGRIVNMASAHGLVASPFKSAYVAAKHGIVGFTKTVALELARDNITCNAICPGFVETPIVSKQIADQARTRNMSEAQVLTDVILAAQPTKRFVTTEELTGIFLYLVSDLGASANGASFSIDGGWTAQ